MPTNLVAIPPVARTVLYYVLALANAVVVPLTASGRVDGDIGLIIVGVSGVFGFTLAASNVSRSVDAVPLVITNNTNASTTPAGE